MTNLCIHFTTDLCTFWLFFLWEVEALVSGWKFYLISSWHCYILMYNHTRHHNIHTLTNKTISLTAVLQTIVVPVFTSYCCSVITTTRSMYINTQNINAHTLTNNCAHSPANTNRLSSDTCSMRTSDVQTHNDVPDTVILPSPLPLTHNH